MIEPLAESLIIIAVIVLAVCITHIIRRLIAWKD